MAKKYSLMVHGGAGEVADKQGAYGAVNAALAAGQTVLERGGTAVDAVEQAVIVLEDEPLFNAGRGSVLNHQGGVDLDAGIMSGIDLSAGAIAGVAGVKNPVQLARAVMQKSEHVFLIGRGAEQFAQQQGITFVDPGYFVIDSRVQQWKAALKANKVVLDHSSLGAPEKKFGTVGAVAYDQHGNLAAATSTGGLVNKKYGRVGDTPIVGAGVYADNATCAVSATGYGEQFIRTVISKHIADIVYYKHVPAPQAAKLGIDYLVKAVKGLGGVIVIDAQGRCGWAYSTSGMIYGHVTQGQQPVAALA